MPQLTHTELEALIEKGEVSRLNFASLTKTLKIKLHRISAPFPTIWRIPENRG